jgi:cobalt-zinc-cadmium resistance protein CzcA
LLGYTDQQKEVALLERRVELSRMAPDFNIGYFSQTMQGVQDVNGSPRNFDAGDRFDGVQAGVSIPLVFGPYTAKNKAARIRQEVARNNAEYYNTLLLGNYKSLLDEFDKNKKTVDYYELQAVPEADLIIDQATRSYKVGALDYLDYIIMLNHALTIKQSYLDALNSYNQTIISIDFITGKTF